MGRASWAFNYGSRNISLFIGSSDRSTALSLSPRFTKPERRKRKLQSPAKIVAKSASFSIQQQREFLYHKKEREMITRSNLAEQLREYQLRSKHQWATLAFLSSTSNSPSRVDTTNLLLRRCVFSSLVFAGVALYFRYTRLALLFICVTFIVLTCMRVTKKMRQNRKYKQRMLLPLSM
ncbi:NADH-ubiquinone oxidoreductase chain [Rhynchospora pubera]|uniref:NADH-ubiquinone oxidoreductase chain n=1 Tax=Rhynchospora pubera TaxID=906938 RepID=A0AAV8GKQ4_9POAL|nr:NADH-ubiquinone oxidoreductase chain [Rhynchospora pubera]